VHVGSIARSGVGSEALDLILRRILPRYPRLDLLVIMVGATDVLRWLEQGATPSTTPVRIADVFRCHPESTFGWTPRRLAVAEAVRRTRRRWLRPVEVHARAGRWIGQARVMRAQATERRSTTPDPTPMLDRFTRHFGSVLTTAKAHADRVLVVRQPWFDRDYSAGEAAQMWHGGAGQVWREQVTSFYSFDVCSRLMALLDSRVADVAGAHRVEQVDLMPVLDRSLDTYYDCFHLTPAGARAIAAVVAAATIARRMAPMYPASAGVPLRTPERSICVDLQAS
jgi:lysophospholipase L1-like esterase